MNPTNRRIRQIDTLRGFGIFMVVFGHSKTIQPVDITQIYILSFIHDFFWNYNMYVFFFVAGYCLKPERIESFSQYLHFVKKKFIHLMIPYYIFNLIDMVPRALFSNAVNKKRSIPESINDILFSGGVYWFLMALFFIFITYQLYYLLFGKKNYSIYILTALIVGLAVSDSIAGIDFLVINEATYYMLAFHLGTLLYRIGFKFQYNKIKKSLLPIIFVISFVLCILCTFITRNPEYIRYRAFATIIAIIGLVLSITFCENTFVDKVFSRFGPYSLQMYLFNSMCIFVTRNLLPIVFHIYNPVIIFIANFSVAFFIPYFFAKHFFGKYKITKLMVGM
ncbi:Fucose 4-O-acetylase [Pseudobutyrivibrio sp. UC1225]|uniref:acyltransferase family protein n=1 Tax=Pseudobutyrivibrio sp. UC1225 TaxID=1798185 RepID=UPI0008F35B5C|nr:acyltransferase [Pseudobutyrivibrio sp. UC1225]SFO21914.1 Fucose 4-O-acetylase [Pseudobutyrivibrio sp. UC1225]